MITNMLIESKTTYQLPKKLPHFNSGSQEQANIFRTLKHSATTYPSTLKSYESTTTRKAQPSPTLYRLLTTITDHFNATCSPYKPQTKKPSQNKPYQKTKKYFFLADSPHCSPPEKNNNS